MITSLLPFCASLTSNLNLYMHISYVKTYIAEKPAAVCRKYLIQSKSFSTGARLVVKYRTLKN